MASPTYTLPGPSAARAPARAPLSKPERARAILSATAAIASAALAVWMLLSALLAPPDHPTGLFAATFGAPRGAAGDLGYFGEDPAAVGGRGDAGAIGLGKFEQGLGTLAGRRRGEPLVVFLTAAGVSRPGTDDDARAWLLAGGGRPGVEGAEIAAADVLELLAKESSGALLILDASQVASDRDLGVFANAFVRRLGPSLKADGRVVVLASAAPGQASWGSSAGRRSAFGHYVARGLAGEATDRWGQVTVRSLHRFVRDGVAGWAAAHRDAVQTPVLLGNVGLDFALPRLDSPRADAEADDAAKERAELLKQLGAHWTARSKLAAAHPYRRAPLAWRLYQGALLRAERLARNGRLAEAKAVLDGPELSGPRAEVERLALGRGADRPLTLATLDDWIAGDPGASPWQKEAQSYREAIARAFVPPAGTPEALEAADEPEPAPPPPGEDDAARPAEPKAGPAPARPPRPAVADAAKAEPPPSADDLVKILGDGSSAGHARFLEGQLALWYARFAAEGGEADSLRSRRLGLLRRAFELREQAEIAADDPRTLGFVRARLEEGDAHRRRAQDDLFASDPVALGRAEGSLRSAGESYAEAGRVAESVRRAIDLVERLQDELPYYADWLARRPAGGDSRLDTLLNGGADLADRLRGEPPAADALADWASRLDGKRRELDDQFARLASDLEAAVRSAVRPGGRAHDWREADALLYVPMIAAADRRALLDTLAEADKAAPFGRPSPGSASDESAPDPAFWEQARVLARVEVGLLRMAGVDDPDLDAYARRAEAREDDEARFEAFDRLSDRVRRLRAERAARVAEGGDRPLEAILREARAVEAVARTLPAAWVEGLRDGELGRADRHARLVWQARRLVQDFDPDHANRLLDEARALLESRELADARVQAQAVARASLALDLPPKGDEALEQGRLAVRARSEGPVPPGHAAVLLGHDAGRSLGVTPVEDDPGGGLVAVPLPNGDGPTSRTFLLFYDRPMALVPELFYRGRIFGRDNTLALKDPGDLIRLEIRQHLRSAKDRVQFADSSRRAYLHPYSEYQFDILATNTTPQDMDVVFNRRQGDGLPATERRKVPAGATVTLGPAGDEPTGRVVAAELAMDKPLVLSVEARDADARDRRLGKPLEAEFRLVDMTKCINIAIGWSKDRIRGQLVDAIHFYVNHVGDPAPLPATVTIRVQPGVWFAENPRRPATQIVRNNDNRAFSFGLTQPLGPDQPLEVQWTATAEGVPVGEGTFVFQQGVHKAPAPANPPPGGPPAPPGGPR